MFYKLFLCILLIFVFTIDNVFSNETEDWINYFALESSSCNNELTISTIDSSGNVIVTGVGYSQNYGNCITTIKYDALGNRIWLENYDGGGLNEIYPIDIVTDLDGNVFVLGEIKNRKTYYDFLILKYDSKGHFLWEKIYNGKDNLDDRPASIALDLQGNIYATGKSESISGYYNFLTLKLNCDGILEWYELYDGDNNFDGAVDIVADISGNVYVAGKSAKMNSKTDIIILKYNSEGQRMWLTRYSSVTDGLANVHNIFLGVDGNFYIIGTESDSHGNVDCVTIKYNPLDGVKVWASQFGNPGETEMGMGITQDENGNIIVLVINEEKNNGFYNSIIKYDQDGNELWRAKELMSQTDGIFRNFPIDIDADGNVYSGGYYTTQDSLNNKKYNYLFTSYNNQGVKNWTIINDVDLSENNILAAIHCVSRNSIFLTGKSYYPDSGYDYTVQNYDICGNKNWTMRHNEIGKLSCSASNIGIDQNDNIYVIGAYINGFLIIKYDRLGNEQWYINHPNPSISYLQYLTSYIDKLGNIYYVGLSSVRSNSIPAGSDSIKSVIIKYSTNGIYEWQTSLNNIKISNLKSDKCGNVYVTGTKSLLSQLPTFITIKYDKFGLKQWENEYDDSSTNIDKSLFINYDSKSNVYICGTNYNSYSNSKCTIVKYSSDGNELWKQTINVIPIDFELDGNDNVLLLGQGIYPNNFVARYLSDGTRDWIINREDISFIKLAISLKDNIFIVARKRDVEGKYVFSTTKYEKTGIKKWDAIFSDFIKDDNKIIDLCVDNNENVYIVGCMDSDIFNDPDYSDIDYINMKYNTEGSIQWIKNYSGVGFSFDKPVGLTIDSNNSIYITGTSGAHSWKVITTMKYNQGQTQVEKMLNDTVKPHNFELLQNYPNPFNSKTIINYQIHKKSKVILEIFNLNGEKIITLINKIHDKGRYSIEWDASKYSSGLYICRIQNGKMFEARKMIFLK